MDKSRPGWGRYGLMLGIAALANLTGHSPAQAEPGAPAADKPKIEQAITSRPLFQSGNPATQLCIKMVKVCDRELQPIGVEVGGYFTVRLENQFRSTYVCRMVDGAPAWVAVSTEGSCEPQPVITLPAQYDEDEAWNVG